MSTPRPCRWVATTAPRMLRTHLRDCNTSGCPGCEPCPERHCALCGIEHVTVEGRGTDETCASCLHAMREDLALIRPANTYRWRGHRHCRTCHRLRQQVRRERDAK